jgi:hypothetical protein
MNKIKSGTLFRSISVKSFRYKNYGERVQGEYKAGSIFLFIKSNERRSFFLDPDGDILEESIVGVERWLREVEI